MKTGAMAGKTVSDIMKRKLVTARSDMTVRELVQLLADAGVSGTPVLDEDDRVVGVVSATDIVRMAAHEAEIPSGQLSWAAQPAREEDDRGDGDDAPYFFTPETPVWFTAPSGSSETAFDEITVGEIMTPVAFSVAAGDSLTEVIRFFLRGRVHRALVLKNGKLEGIVTPFDVLAAVLEDSDAEV